MKHWFASQNGVITLSAIALLTYLARTFVDFQFVIGEFVRNAGIAAIAATACSALFGGWFWSVAKIKHGSRTALIAAFSFTLIFCIGMGVSTIVVFCPSPCPTAWPLMEIANWTNLITGTLALIGIGLQF
jgi:hypothetical protein